MYHVVIKGVFKEVRKIKIMNVLHLNINTKKQKLKSSIQIRGQNLSVKIIYLYLRLVLGSVQESFQIRVKTALHFASDKPFEIEIKKWKLLIL
jgi:hypothetical protein